MQLFTGKQYLQIDIASSFGLDKEDWPVRLEWFDQHKDRLLEMLPQAKEPALYFAGVQAWEDTQKGIPSGYPISLDATCSGLQLLAVLTGDRSAARLCNVISTGHREDAYVSLYHSMVKEIGEGAKIKRDKTKEAIMTAFYGSKAMPKQIFGEGMLLNIFYATMKRECPAAWELNETYLSIWNPEALEYNLVFPDNYHANLKVISQEKTTVHYMNEPYDIYTKVNAPMEGGRSLGANTNHGLDGMVVREMSRRCNYDAKKVAKLRTILTGEILHHEPNEEDYMVQILWEHYTESGYLSARIIDYINETNAWLVDVKVVMELLDSLPAKPFEVISVHDCFRCLPNYGNDLRKQYNNQLYLIAKSNLLSVLLSQLLGKKIHINKLDPKLYLDILDTEYALS